MEYELDGWKLPSLSSKIEVRSVATSQPCPCHAEMDERDIQFFKAFSTDHELPRRLINPSSSLPDLRWIVEEPASIARMVSRLSRGLEAEEDSPSISCGGN